MRTLTRLAAAVAAAMLTIFSSAAFGVTDPDTKYPAMDSGPTSRGGVCLGDGCESFFLYATQHFDCSKAGTAVPRPVENANPFTNFADIGSYGQSFYSNPDPSASDLNNDGKVDRTDYGILQQILFGGAPGGTPPNIDFADLATPPASAQQDESTPANGGNQPSGPDQPASTTMPDASSMKGGMQTGAGQSVAQGSLNFSLIGGDAGQVAGAAQDAVQYKLFPKDEAVGADSWPDDQANNNDYGFNSGPVAGVAPGSWSLDFDWTADLALRADYYDSINVESTPGALNSAGLDAHVVQSQLFGGRQYATLQFPVSYSSSIQNQLQQVGGITIQPNWCRMVLIPEDPNYRRTGRHGGNSWGEQIDDQWAIKRVGFTDGDDSAWNLVPDSAAAIVVAVIDTGLDWHHRDIDARSIWRNTKEIPGNGIDDDRNGYVDDIIGWNFLAGNNKPWDHDGHGTIVAGIIAAAHNDIGIAGVNPRAQIMVLKGINNFGTTRASYIAEAVKYAADNGARIINLSVGGSRISDIEAAAIQYAQEKGVLVLAAAGNEGIELDDYSPGGLDGVMTIGATHVDDRAAAFSNYGERVDLAAPGVDVLSLRARFTDANYRPAQEGNDEYSIGDAFVGDDNRYFHASGTSFSTPIVAGIASLVMAANPELTAAEVQQVLQQTAQDVDLAGKDKYTGHGLVDARAALSADPGFAITADISRVELLPADAPAYVRVYGTINASTFKRAWVQIGAGENPHRWRHVGAKRKFPIDNGLIAAFPFSQLAGEDLWQIVVNVEDANGVLKRAVYPLEVR